MRVALVCPYAIDDPGGVQVHVLELAARLRGRGHEIAVLAPVRGPVPPAGVTPVGRPVDVRFNRANAPIDPRPWAWRRLRAALTAARPEVVHVHEPFAPSTGLWATLASPAPVVATFHSGVPSSLAYDVAAPALRRVARRIRVRVAVSRAAATVAARRIGGRFEIVPNGVDVARFRDAAPADLGPGRKLLFVGRLDARKGFPVALAAFERLARGRADVRLVVAGDGPDREAVAALPRTVRDRIAMLGSVPNADVPSIDAACDVYLGASIGGESFGIVVVEAMAAGVPVVASHVPGYDEVVTDGVDGLLVRPGDAGAFAAAAGSVLDDPDLAGRLAAAGRRRAEGFDWGVVVPRLEACYAEAIDQRPPSLR